MAELAAGPHVITTGNRGCHAFFGYAIFGLGLGLLLLAGAALVFDLGALKPLYERVAGYYLESEVRRG